MDAGAWMTLCLAMRELLPAPGVDEFDAVVLDGEIVTVEELYAARAELARLRPSA